MSGLCAAYGESLLKILLIHVTVLYQLFGYMPLNYTWYNEHEWWIWMDIGVYGHGLYVLADA